MLSSTATVHRRQKHHWRTKRLISNTWPHNEASHSRFPFPVAFFLPGLAGSAGLAGFTGIFGLFNLRRLVWDALTGLEVVGGLGLQAWPPLLACLVIQQQYFWQHTCQATASATQTAAATAPSAVQAL